MFVIKPIADKQEQQTCCALCKVPYIEGALAYRADAEGGFAGICQFSLENGHGMIYHLRPLPGVDDYEMMFIMGRTAMNFIDLCELHICHAAKDAGEERLLLGIGFKKQADGTYEADMQGMFGGCGGSGQHH